LDIQTAWLEDAATQFDPRSLHVIDGLVLTGGADVEPHCYGYRDEAGRCAVFPDRDEAELAMLEEALARRLPIFAICRGMQLTDVFQGGTLRPHIGGHRLRARRAP
jgi:putative glutamine amidotransferase